MWFIKKSDYESLKRECGKLQDEVVFYRNKLRESDKELKETKERVDMLYEQARASADAKGRLASNNEALTKEVNELRALRRTNMDFAQFKKYLNPEPEDPEIRRAYVSQIAGFFSGGLRDYLDFTIGLLKDEISRFPLSERETDFFRSGVNICSLLNEWGDRMIREHRANATEGDTNNVFEANDTAVENIREAINK